MSSTSGLNGGNLSPFEIRVHAFECRLSTVRESCRLTLQNQGIRHQVTRQVNEIVTIEVLWLDDGPHLDNAGERHPVVEILVT